MAADLHSIKSIQSNRLGMRQAATKHLKSDNNRRDDRTFQHQIQKATRHIKSPTIEGSPWLDHDAKPRVVLSATSL
jgi:hypothetical protein